MLKYIFRMLFRDAKPKKPTPEPKIEPFRKPVVGRRPIAESKRPSIQPTSKSIKGKCYVIDGDTISSVVRKSELPESMRRNWIIPGG
jgi:hypothetical protein